MNKETMNTLLMTVGFELAAVFALVGLFLIWKIKKGKKSDRKAAEQLVENIKENELGRRESLLKVFGESYDMDKDELADVVDEFLKRERIFFKTLISVYLERNADEFPQLTMAVEEMVKPYSDLALSSELSSDNEELETLKQQNQQLEKELKELGSEDTEAPAPVDKKLEEETSEDVSVTLEKVPEKELPEEVTELSSADDEKLEESPDVEKEMSELVDDIEDTSDDKKQNEIEIELQADLEVDTPPLGTSSDENESAGEDDSVESARNEVALDEFDEELEA